VVIGIETDRGLWVQALIGAGYRVFAIDPLQVARFRERHRLRRPRAPGAPPNGSGAAPMRQGAS
jgi:hypothetical protein